MEIEGTMTGVGEGADAELKSSAMEDQHQHQLKNQCTDNNDNNNNKEEESISSNTQAKPLYPPPHFSPYNFYPPPPANFPFPDPSASSADVYPSPAYPPPPPTGSMQGPSPFHHQWPPIEPHGYPSWPHLPYQPYPYPNSYSYPYPCYPPIHHHQPHHGPHPHPPHFPAGDYDGVQEAAPAIPTENPIAFGSEQVDANGTNGVNGVNSSVPAAVAVEEIGNPNELYPLPLPVPHIFPGGQGGEAGLEALVSIAAFIQQQFAAARDAVKPQVDVEVEVGGTPTPTPSSVLPQETEEEEDSSVKVAVDNQQTPVEQLNKSLSRPSEEPSLHLGYPGYDYSSSQYQYDQQALYPPPSSYYNPYPPSYDASSWGGPTAGPSTVSEFTDDPAQENSKPIPQYSYDQALYPPPPPHHHHYPYYPPPHYGPGFPAPPPPVFTDPTNSAGDIPSNSGSDYWNTQYQQHHHQYPHFPPFPPFPHPHCHYSSCWPQPSSSGPWQNQNHNNNLFPQPQQPNFSPSAPPPMLYPDAKHPYTQYFKDLIKSFSETQKTNLEGVEDGTVEHQTWEKGNILEGLVDDEDDDDEEPQYVLTEEWAEFFAKAEARRKEKKGQAKKQAKAARKAARTLERTQSEDDIVKSLENMTLNVEGNKVDEEHVVFKGAEERVQETSPDHKQDLVGVGLVAEGKET